MIIRSRSLLNPRLIRVSASPNGKPPGPPARYTTGSGAGVDDFDGTIPTVRLIVRPFGRARFSGTIRKPQWAFSGSVVATGSVGHPVGVKLGVGSGDAAPEAAPVIRFGTSATEAAA